MPFSQDLSHSTSSSAWELPIKTSLSAFVLAFFQDGQDNIRRSPLSRGGRKRTPHAGRNVRPPPDLYSHRTADCKRSGVKIGQVEAGRRAVPGRRDPASGCKKSRPFPAVLGNSISRWPARLPPNNPPGLFGTPPSSFPAR